MIRDEFPEYHNGRSLSTLGVDDINQALKAAANGGTYFEVSDKTVARIIGYDRSSSMSEPSYKKLQGIFIYFVKNEKSNYYLFAKSVSTWIGFVKYIDSTFKNPVFQKNLPPKYNRGQGSIDEAEFSEWMIKCQKIINETVLPKLKQNDERHSFAKPIDDDKEFEGLQSKNESVQYFEFTNSYWEKLIGKKSKDDLIKYYTNINSSSLLLPSVIAEDFYVPNEEIIIKAFSSSHESVKTSIYKVLPPKAGNNNTFIRINANGGTGKSTLLYHIGKKYFDEYHVLYFTELPNKLYSLPKFTEDYKPVIILLDNYSKFSEQLNIFAQELNKLYFSRGYSLITTERYIQESIIDKKIIREVDENFSEVIECTINHPSPFYENIFDKIIHNIDSDSKISDDRRKNLKERFAEKSKATIAERIIDFILNINHANLGFQFSFDWEDWEELCKNDSLLNPYSNLYSIVAAFNNYNITPPIEFCINLLGIKDPYLINTYSIFSKPYFDFPILIKKDKCFELRNPNLSKWFIKERDSTGILTKKYFQLALAGFNNSENMYLLRNSYRNYELRRKNELGELIPEKEKLLLIFESYIKANPKDLDNAKNKMEMVVINLQKNDITNAKTILKEMVSADSKEIHARTKLADILIRENNFDEAKPLVDFLTLEEPTNNYIIKLRIAVLKHSAKEENVIRDLIKVLPENNILTLKYLYAKLAKSLRLSGQLKEAEECCNKLLSYNSSDSAAMNTLAIIFQQQDKLIEAEELLNKAISLQPYNAHNFNELGQVYVQLYDESKNPEYKFKALETFIKGLKVAKENIPLRTEFARFLMNYCQRYIFAEHLLLFNIQKDHKHFHSYTELGKLYQWKHLFIKSKEILEKGKEQIPNENARVEHIPLFVILGSTYLELEEFAKAENAFQKTLDLKPENWISHYGKAKALLKQNKTLEFEDELNKIINDVNDIISLCDFANWLKNNDRIEDAIKIIEKAKRIIGDKPNEYINTIWAGILLEKIISKKYSDSLEVVKLNGQCEKICNDTLKSNPNHEPSLHILYRLNLFFRESTQENRYLRASYSKKYKKYLGKLFLVNRQSIFAFEAMINHLKTTRRYRLAITFINKYGSISKNPSLFIGHLSILYGFMENKKEIELLRAIANENKLKLPNVQLDSNVELISQNNVGFLIGNKINSANTLYDIAGDNINANYTAKKKGLNETEGVKVFFGLYKTKGFIVANCIEPYFEKLPSDDSVLKLLELEVEN